MRITEAGNVGIGTTSPATTLAISGHCVTADTRLRRRRKARKGEEGEADEEGYVYDEPQIVDLEEGDEIQSLDERAGELVWSRVNRLMFMGVKQTYRITTEDGREIRTTAEHPYLVKNAKGKWLRHASPIENAGWAVVSELREGDEIAVYGERVEPVTSLVSSLSGLLIENFHDSEQGTLNAENDSVVAGTKPVGVGFVSAFKLLYVRTILGVSKFANRFNIVKHLTLELSAQSSKTLLGGGVQDVAVHNYTPSSLRSVGPSNHFFDFLNPRLIFATNFGSDISTRSIKSSSIELEMVEAGAMMPRILSSLMMVMADLLIRRDDTSTRYMSSNEAKMNNGFVWSKIRSIEAVAEEEVYDIEIEGTHNFVANGIVAHNTYLTGGLGAGVLNTTSGTIQSSGNITAGGVLAINGTSGTTTIASGQGFTIGSSQFVLQQGSGNVGIGTAAPGAKLEVDSTTGQVAILNSTATGGAYMTLQESGTVRGYYGVGQGILTNALSGSLGFRSQGALHFGTGGDNVRMTIDSATGNLGIGTTTPMWLLNPTSASAAQLALSAGAGVSQWAFRNAGGTFYLATTTVAGTATSTASALTIDTNGIPSFPSLGGATGCAQFNSSGTLSNTSTACGTGGGTFSFTPTLNFGANTNATSTALSLFGGLNASSTIRFGNAGVSGFLFDSTTGNLGLGTTTPWGQLSINPNGITGPSFVIGSSTATSFIVTNGGNVGIGTTTPFTKFSLQGTDTSASTKGFVITDSTASALLTVFNNGLTLIKNLLVTASSTIGDGTQAGGLTVSGGATTTGNALVQGSATTTGNQNVGGILSVSGTATSTFTNGISASYLNLTGTSATSTFGNGISLTNGCISLNGTNLCGSNPASVTLTQVVASSSVGSNTSFTVPTNTAYIVVEVWGSGGGGGGGASATGAGGNGGDGGQTCFGTNSTACTSPTIAGNGGTHGLLANSNGSNGTLNGGGGGLGGTVATAGDVSIVGGGGSGGGVGNTANTGSSGGGGGGSAPAGGGGGAGGNPGGAGAVGASFGGGGGGGSGGASGGGGGGGGSGAYVKKIISNPSGTYYYTIPAGGTAGTGGSGGGSAGGVGGAGGVTISVYTTAQVTSAGAGVTLTRVVTATSGTNVTYTPPSNISYIEVETWGAGGGGGGYNTTGSSGGSTCFGTNSTACTSPTISATGGGGAAWATGNDGGAGGAGSGGDLNLTGGYGNNGTHGGASTIGMGGVGGSAPRGGGSGENGGGGGAGSVGGNFGGGGGGGSTNVNAWMGGGGGGGGYAQKIITAPSGTYYYTVGVGGTAGSGGGAGGAGGIVIREYTTSALQAVGTQGQAAYFTGTNTTAGTSTLFFATSGNVGIGTTTPNWNLQVAGTRPSFALSDTNAGTNLKHWLFSSMGGNLYVGTTTDAYATSTNAALTITNAGFTGHATSSPWGLLSVNPNGISGPAFVVGSSTKTSFIVTNNNNSGFGTTTPWGKLSIDTTLMDAGAPSFVVGSSTRTDLIVTQAGKVGIGTTTPWAQFSINSNGLLGPAFAIGSSTATVFTVSNGGNVGVGTTTPFRLLSMTGAVSTAQQAIAYDTTNWTDLLTSSVGDLFVYPSGNDAFFNNSNLWVCTGGSSNTNGCPSGTPSGQGNLIVESKIGIASSTPWAALSIGANGAIVTTEKSLSDGVTIAISWLDGNQQVVTLGGNRAVTFSNYIPGQVMRLVLCQDATGSRTITSWPSAVLWSGGSAPTLTTTANKCDVLSFISTAATGTVKIFGATAMNF